MKVIILQIGTVELLTYESDTDLLTLNDGTNTPTDYPLASGSHDLGLALGSNDGGITSFMQLKIDGVWQASAAYTPIVAGLIATNSTHRDMRSNLESNFTDAVATIDGWTAP